MGVNPGENTPLSDSSPHHDRASILVVENEPLVAELVTRVLREGGFSVAGVATTGQDALDQVERCDPDLVVMDIALDGEMNGVDVGRVLAATRATPLLYLTAHCDEDTLLQARATNAVGYVVKPFSNRQLHSAVVMATGHAGRTSGAVASPVDAQRVEHGLLAIAQILRGMGIEEPAGSPWSRRPEVAALSKGEMEIVKHLVDGRRASSIAALRGVSPHTVRNQIKAIFRKLGVHSQSELVDWLRGR